MQVKLQANRGNNIVPRLFKIKGFFSVFKEFRFTAVIKRDLTSRLVLLHSKRLFPSAESSNLVSHS